MLKSPGDGSEPMFKKVKYVFTNPEGAIANLEFMQRAMGEEELAGRLVVKVFDRSGAKRMIRSVDEAAALLAHLKGGVQ